MLIGRLTVIASLALALGSPHADAQPRTLRIVAPWEASLDPARTGFVFTRLQIAETLAGADDGGALQPQLAASWAVSDDRLVWRFTLRSNAVFHDRTPVTPETVVRSLARARTPSGVLGDAPIASIEAPGSEVVIRTARPFMSLPAFLAHSSTLILAPSSYDTAGAVTAILGSGPYRVTDLQMPARVEAGRAESWNGPSPAIERVSYLAITNGDARTAMAMRGDADLVTTLGPDAASRLRGDSRFDVHVVPIPRTRTIKLNAGSPFFADVRVRQAISLAIDRDGMAATLLRSPLTAATQMFPPALAEWYVPSLAPLGHDPAAARTLLDVAGWRTGLDGIRTKDGRAFRVTLRTFPDRPELPPLAETIQTQLRDVGIDMRIAVGDSNEIPAGHKDGTLEMALLARNFALVPDPLGTMLQDFGPRGGDWGAMNWSDPALLDALDRLGRVSDARERIDLRRRISEILQTELPVIPVAWYDLAAVSSRKVAGVSVDPLELSYRVTAMRWAD